ncbi:hypothetical protein LTR53_002634 [Teratosphaeriaceae sp. CCFEE 6253]|nr:hypothetical protein LTR53_002634 [Teratosphaeriaceae sp. CCFEE 6253]
MDSLAEGDAFPKIHLYAENLQNIRTLSIQASLATPSNEETKATLSNDRENLTISHDGATATIRLPASLGEHSADRLMIPATPRKNLSFRLQVGETRDADGSRGGSPLRGDNIIPWMASDLTHDTSICCATCEASLMKPGIINQWKDLPSEGWAEMMDFWHCHKPDVPHSHSGPVENASRGFAAISKLVAQEGVGLVGPTNFLITPEDCKGVQVQIKATDGASVSPLLCAQCQTLVGILDPSAEGYKLRKTKLSISITQCLPAVCYPYEKWLSSILLTAAESQGVRRLVVFSAAGGVGKNEVEQVMHVWLFAPDLAVSSSAAESAQPMRVVKVLYHSGVPAEVEKPGGFGDVEDELELSSTEWTELESLLGKSAKLLPEAARRFQHWDVGLLMRFTRHDLNVGA